jgi:asparagine synthetase B (glutamine-hydrolysing)
MATWHRSLQQLTLARDPAGQHAVYVRETPDLVLFSSCLRSLLASGVALDVQSAAQLMLRGSPTLGRTLAIEVRSVPAAHTMTFTARQPPLLDRYWTPARETIEVKDGAAAVRTVISESVRQLLPRGSTALLLSGGVDSSLIACLAARARKRPPDCYSLIYDTPDSRVDRRYARIVSKALGARHVVVRLSLDDALRHLDAVLARPIPAAAWTALSHRQILEAVKADGHVTLLSGMGADEVFGGYERFLDYYFLAYADAHARHPRQSDPMRVLFDRYGRLPSMPFPGIAEFFDSKSLRRYLHPDAPAQLVAADDLAFYRAMLHDNPAAHTCQVMVAHECQFRIPELLMASFEPLSHEAGVGIRYPFLTTAVIDIGASLDFRDRYWYARGAWWAKKTLREAAKPVVPPCIPMRRRVAYDVPIGRWMQHEKFKRVVRERIADSGLWQLGFLEPSLRDRLADRRHISAWMRSNPDRWLPRMWIVLVLAAWWDHFGGVGRPTPSIPTLPTA